MTKKEYNNWYDMPWLCNEPGIKSVSFAEGAELVCCKVEEYDPTHTIQQKKYPREHMAFCLNGECECHVDGDIYQLRENSWITIPAGIPYDIAVIEGNARCIVLKVTVPESVWSDEKNRQNLTVRCGNLYDNPWEFVRKGITRTIFGMGMDHFTTAIGACENGHDLNPHKHPYEQVALCVAGKFDFYIGETCIKMIPGSYAVVPPDVLHYAETYETDIPALGLDIFAPVRRPYEEGYLAFLEKNRDA